jgi:hypothetical protein
MNAPGPVYVENGGCLACGVPEMLAPEIFSWDESSGYPHCFVKRQPESDAEFAKVLAVLRNQELDCVRVRNCREPWRSQAMAVDRGAYVDDDPAEGAAD